MGDRLGIQGVADTTTLFVLYLLIFPLFLMLSHLLTHQRKVCVHTGWLVCIYSLEK